MLKKGLRFLLGLNIASFVLGLRLGLPAFIKGGIASYHANHPFQNRIQYESLESIPEVSLGEILGARKAAIKLKVQKYEEGMLPTNEAMALLSIVGYWKNA